MEILNIHLNSTNATKFYNGTCNSYVEFTMPVIEIPTECTIYLSVSHVSIPYSFYNVNTNNNMLSYSIGSTLYTVYIPVGNYTTSNLLTTLKSILSPFTISYSGITNKFTFTHPTNDFIFNYSTNSVSSTCLGLLGFSNNYHSSSVRVLTSDLMVNLCPTRCVCISSSFLTQSIATIAPFANTILCSIPISVNPFTNITWSNNGCKTNLNTNIFSSIIIKLTDQDGNVLDFNGINWSISLQLDIENFVN